MPIKVNRSLMFYLAYIYFTPNVRVNRDSFCRNL